MLVEWIDRGGNVLKNSKAVLCYHQLGGAPQGIQGMGPSVCSAVQAVGVGDRLCLQEAI